MPVGANIKQLLREKNQTITWLSEKSEVNRNTLYSIIRKDNIKVNPETLEKIAAVLNTTVEELTLDKSENSAQQDESKVSSEKPSAFTTLSYLNGEQSPRSLKEYQELDFQLMIIKLQYDCDSIYEDPFYRSLPLEEKQNLVKRREYEIAILKAFHSIPEEYSLEAIKRLHNLFYEILKNDKQQEKPE